MSAESLIFDHDIWRKGAGGAPAGVVGQSDASAYSGLDLGLITFTSSTFSASRFSAMNFQDAQWSSCRFSGCSFNRCDMQRMSLTGCLFFDCTFAHCSFDHSQFSDCRFSDCTWNALTFDQARWRSVALLNCVGSGITAQSLQGQQVDFTGSQFKDMQLNNARIN